MECSKSPFGSPSLIVGCVFIYTSFNMRMSIVTNWKPQTECALEEETGWLLTHFTSTDVSIMKCKSSNDT